MICGDTPTCGLVCGWLDEWLGGLVGEFQGKLNGPKKCSMGLKTWVGRGRSQGSPGSVPAIYVRFYKFCDDCNLIIAHRNFRQVKKFG